PSTRPNFFLLFFSSFSFVPPTNSKLSERVRSGGKLLPPAAGKRAQVDFDPVSPSPFEEAPLPLLEGTFLCGFSSKILNFAPFLGFVTLSGLVMASADPSLIMRDHLYSLDDRLKRGRPPPLLKSAYEGIIIDGEPAPETAPVFFGDVNKNEPCRLASLISLWLGRFLFYDFFQDCLHERVLPLAIVIACGSVLPLALMFLGHLYYLLDQV
ncbi:unnamed protein product, partial [Prunus brigantina]